MKRNAETIPVPQSREQADKALCAIGAAQRQLALIQAALDESVAEAKAKAEAQAAPLKVMIEQTTAGLQIWAEANRAALTEDGKRQTVTLPSGEIGWRRRPPSVRAGNIKLALEDLLKRGLDRFIRVKRELDKEAMLKEPELAATVPGISIGSAGEEFVVQPTATPLAA